MPWQHCFSAVLPRALPAIVVLIMLSACSSSPAPRVATEPAAPRTTTTAPSTTAATSAAGVNVASANDPLIYQLGSGDRVKVTVFRHEDLSGEFELDGQGRFSMPLIGEVSADGLGSRQLEQEIAGRYSDGYLVEPQISVEVLTYRPFYILGEVNNPGSYNFVNGMTVINAVALAGGFSYRASEGGILIQKGGSNAAQQPATPDMLVLPGDVVTVPERFF